MVASAVIWSSLSKDERRVAGLIGNQTQSFNSDQLREVRDLLRGARDLGIKRLDKISEVQEIRRFLNRKADPLGLQPTERERVVSRLAGFNADQLSDQELMLSRDYLNVADQIGLGGIQRSEQLDQVQRSISAAESSTERPPNLQQQAQAKHP